MRPFMICLYQSDIETDVLEHLATLPSVSIIKYASPETASPLVRILFGTSEKLGTRVEVQTHVEVLKACQLPEVALEALRVTDCPIPGALYRLITAEGLRLLYFMPLDMSQSRLILDR